MVEGKKREKNWMQKKKKKNQVKSSNSKTVQRVSGRVMQLEKLNKPNREQRGRWWETRHAVVSYYRFMLQREIYAVTCSVKEKIPVFYLFLSASTAYKHRDTTTQ